jgi:hypothetical protein
MLLGMYIISGSILMLLSIPMIYKKIKPNGLYGFRVKRTLENPEIWYAVNSYSGKWLFATGFIVILASIILNYVPGISLDTYALSALAIFSIAFVIAIIASVRYMNSLP